jgi:Rap1a immunity proteins
MRWLILLLAIVSSNALSLSGNDLQTYCNAGNSLCFGYITGVNETLLYWQGNYRRSQSEAGPLNSKQIFWLSPNVYCTPKTVTNGQIQQVVTKYLNEHPEDLHIDASLLIGKALTAAYPCPDGVLPP